ncbi:MAG: hypothetical protein RQ751_06390 [Longimicrobiales bacterium]|nr:hypothetical protein [Longimicrobiales bacterium]
MPAGRLPVAAAVVGVVARTLAAVAAAVSCGHAAPVAAQIRIPLEVPAITTDLPPLALADTLYFRERVQESLAVLDGQLATAATDSVQLLLAAHWRVARGAVTLAILAEDPDPGLDLDPDAAQAWLERAAAHGDSALAVDSAHVDALFWAAAAMGRLALHHGPRTSATLAEEVWTLAHRLLERDPGHGGGHNILGKLNQEVMSLSGWERFLGRLLLRARPLREASWEAALTHHRRAVALEPEAVLFHLDLGRTLQLTGARDEARTVFRRGLALPRLFPMDGVFQRRIAEHLEALDEGG